MKKLMTLAALAAVSGAFAACQYIAPVAPTIQDAAWAYKWKFTGKTTKAVVSNCDQALTRTGTSLKIEGYSFYCEPECGAFETMEADEYFWQKKPAKALFEVGSGVTFEVANVIGKKGKEFEAAGKGKFATEDGIYAYDIMLAGLGKYDSKHARVKCCKGNFAGTAAAPQATKYNKSNCGYDSKVSLVWPCCGCPSDEADSVAYGKWSVKFNKSWAKKAAAGKLSTKIYPKWAR